MSAAAPKRSRTRRAARLSLAWGLGWLFAAALYLLLIDITDEPELLVGIGAAALAATGLELVRQKGVVGEGIRARWLLRVYRPLLNIPVDVILISFVALRRLWRRPPVEGRWRAVRFRCGDVDALERGRHGLALGLGSLAPNTIAVGIDEKREVILAHQLVERGGRAAIDVLDLG